MFSMASRAECESFFQANVFFSPSFSDALVNATALTLLLEVLLEKAIQSRRFS